MKLISYPNASDHEASKNTTNCFPFGKTDQHWLFSFPFCCCSICFTPAIVNVVLPVNDGGIAHFCWHWLHGDDNMCSLLVIVVTWIDRDVNTNIFHVVVCFQNIYMYFNVFNIYILLLWYKLVQGWSSKIIFILCIVFITCCVKGSVCVGRRRIDWR